MSKPGPGRRWISIGAIAALVASPLAWAQGNAAHGFVYSCVDAAGKRLTSDRLIPQCADREQRILNPDGSLNRIESPVLTADEKADAEARDREAAAERVTRQDAIRRDRNLMQRFPNEAAHKAAREKALDDIRSAIKLSETRINALFVERKPLLDEAEFYIGKSMPGKLRGQLDANEASLTAQRSLTQNQQGEVVRITSLYDNELVRLRKLWSGALPGSMGPAGAASAVAPVAPVSVPQRSPAASKPMVIASTGVSTTAAKTAANTAGKAK